MQLVDWVRDDRRRRSRPSMPGMSSTSSRAATAPQQRNEHRRSERRSRFRLPPRLRVEPCLSEPSLWASAARDDVFASLRERESRHLAGRARDDLVGPWTRLLGGSATCRRPPREPKHRSVRLRARNRAVRSCRSRLHARTAACSTWTHPSTRASARYVTSAFSARRVGELEDAHPLEAVRAILDAICEAGAAISPRMPPTRLPTAVTCDLLGVPTRGPACDRWTLSVSRTTRRPEVRTARGLVPRSQRTDRLRQAARRERLRVPSDDLLTVLATEEIEGERLDEDEVGTFFELLITAGIETTGAAIAHGLVALSEHPDQRDLWKSDFATHAASAVEEMLRWSTPIIHFRRTAVTHTQIAGVDIAAGDKVLVFFNSANRDEAVFDDPHSFEIRRAPESSSHLRRRRSSLLPRRTPGEARDTDPLRATLPAPSRHRRIRYTELHALDVLQRCDSSPCEFTPRPPIRS